MLAAALLPRYMHAVHTGGEHAGVCFLTDPLCLVPGASQRLGYFWDNFSVSFVAGQASESPLPLKTFPCFS